MCSEAHFMPCPNNQYVIFSLTTIVSFAYVQYVYTHMLYHCNYWGYHADICIIYILNIYTVLVTYSFSFIGDY